MKHIGQGLFLGFRPCLVKIPHRALGDRFSRQGPQLFFRPCPKFGRSSAREGILRAAVPVKATISARGNDTSNSGLVDPSLRSG